MRWKALLCAVLVVLAGCGALGGSSPDGPGEEATGLEATPTETGANGPADGTTTADAGARTVGLELERGGPSDLRRYDPSHPFGRAVATDDRPVFHGLFATPSLDPLLEARYVAVGDRFYSVENAHYEWLYYRVGVERVAREPLENATPVSELPEDAREVVATAIAEGRYFSADRGAGEPYASASHYEHVQFGAELDERLFRTDAATYRYDGNLSFGIVEYPVEVVDPENVSGTAIDYRNLTPRQQWFADAMTRGEDLWVWGGFLDELETVTIRKDGVYYRLGRGRHLPSRPPREMRRLQVDAERVANETVYEEYSVVDPSRDSPEVAAALRRALANDGTTSVRPAVADRIRSLLETHEYVVVNGEFYRVRLDRSRDAP